MLSERTTGHPPLAATPLAPTPAPPRPAGLLRATWALAGRTTSAALRYRFTGLAAEAAFFALLSLPPLMLGLLGVLGHLRAALGAHAVDQVRDWIVEGSRAVVSDALADRVVVPLMDDMLRGGRIDVVSLGFLVALWCGSRALNVYVDTIAIAYGLGGVRGIVATRALSFSLYVLALLGAVLLSPMLVTGRLLVGAALPGHAAVQVLSWLVVAAGSVAALATLYHISVPARTAWSRTLPGAALALAIWLVGGAGLRLYLGVSLGGTSLYGTLAAPIAALAWLYVTAFAVLVGAALNAELDRGRRPGEAAAGSTGRAAN